MNHCVIEYSHGFVITTGFNHWPSSSSTFRYVSCLSNSSKPEKQGFQSISITDCSICIGWVRIGGIAGSTVQRGVADKSGDCIVRSGSNREQQSEPRPYICRPSSLHRLPRCLLVHFLFPRNMVNPVSFQFIFQTKPCIYHIHFPSLYESLSVIS